MKSDEFAHYLVPPVCDTHKNTELELVPQIYSNLSFASRFLYIYKAAEMISWNEANKICKYRNYSLLSIENSEDKDMVETVFNYLKKKCNALGSPVLYLGITKSKVKVI